MALAPAVPEKWFIESNPETALLLKLHRVRRWPKAGASFWEQSKTDIPQAHANPQANWHMQIHMPKEIHEASSFLTWKVIALPIVSPSFYKT